MFMFLLSLTSQLYEGEGDKTVRRKSAIFGKRTDKLVIRQYNVVIKLNTIIKPLIRKTTWMGSGGV